MTSRSKIAPGIYHGLDIEEYHADPSLSSSGLRQFIESPATFEQWVKDQTNKIHVPHFDEGNAFELKLLDPKGYSDEVFVLDENSILTELSSKYQKPRASKAYKEWYDVQMESWSISQKKYLVNSEATERSEMMLANCYSNPTINLLLQNIDYQLSCFWTDQDTGLQLRSRPDVRIQNKNVIIDVKTASDGSPKVFRRDILKYKLWFQAAMQIEGCLATGVMDSVDTYFWLVVEKKSPYHAQLYSMSDEFMENSIREFHEVLSNFKLYADNKLMNTGYGYREDRYGIIDIDIPPQYLR